MNIGILGAGTIGTTLAQKLAGAGHTVKIANSRGPETIAPEALQTGAQAVVAQDAVTDVEVVILAMPYAGFEKVRPLVAALADDTVVIDLSNYWPQRDGQIPAIDGGQIESEYVQEVLGRRVTKAWNAINADPFATNGRPKGHPERVAIPVAGDRARDREVAMKLVEDTGFDAFDAGVIADSWRQQPAAPVYCTNLRLDEIKAALDAAERERLPKRRDIIFTVLAERFGALQNPDTETSIRIARALQM